MNFLEHRDAYLPQLNYFSRERLDPLIAYLSDSLGRETPGNIYVIGQVLILLLGLFLLFSTRLAGSTSSSFSYRFTGRQFNAGTEVPSLSFSNHVLLSLATTALIVVFSGGTWFGLKSHWFPLFLFAIFRLKLSDSIPNIIFAFLVTNFWIWTSGSLATSGMVLGGILVVFSAMRLEDYSRQLNRVGNIDWFFLIIGFGLLASVLAIPVYPMPDYPPTARFSSSPQVVPTVALLGPYMSPVIVDSSRLKLLAFYHVILFCLLILGFGLIVILNSIFFNTELRTLNKTKVVCAEFRKFIAVFLILFVHAYFVSGLDSRIFKFDLLERVVPGLGLVKLPFLLTPIVLSAVVYLFLPMLITKAGQLVLALVVGVCFLLQSFAFPRVDLETLNEEPTPLRSPSSLVLSELGLPADRLGILAQLGRGEHVPIGPLESLVREVDATVNEAEASLAYDRSHRSKWSTVRPQVFGDSFRVSLKIPVRFDKLLLSAKPNPQSMPSGLRVAVLENGKYRVIADYPIWIGNLRWTSLGYPYFETSAQIEINLEKPIEATELIFTQIGPETGVDWAINDIRLFKKKRRGEL